MPTTLRADTPAEPSAAADRLAALYDNLADFREIAIHEREHLDGLRERLGAATITFVPYLARDVYDFDALHESRAGCSSGDHGATELA